jgi:hypothetical protein
MNRNLWQLILLLSDSPEILSRVGTDCLYACIAARPLPLAVMGLRIGKELPKAADG